MSVESVIVHNHLILCQPLPLFCSIFPSIRVFSNQSALCIRRSKHWSFSHSPSNEWLISSWLVWSPCGSRSLALISWLQSLSTVIWNSWEKKKNLSLLPVFPFYLPWSDRTRSWDLREEIRDDLFVLRHFSLPNGCTCYLDYMNFCDFLIKKKGDRIGFIGRPYRSGILLMRKNWF